MIAGNGNIKGPRGRIVAAGERWARGITDIDDQKTGIRVCHVRMIAGDGNTMRPAGRIIASNRRGACGITNINDQKTGVTVRHIQIIAGDGGAIGEAGSVISICEGGIRRIADVDHLEPARHRFRYIAIITVDGNVQCGVVGVIAACQDRGQDRIGDMDDLQTGVIVRHKGVLAGDGDTVGPVRSVVGILK